VIPPKFGERLARDSGLKFELLTGGNMKKRTITFLAALAVTCLRGISSAFAQGAPDIVWEVPTPNSLANSIVGVGWASGVSGQVAMGSTDRWLRTRQAASGALSYSILGPQHSRGGDQTIYSHDGAYLAVHNLNKGLDYRVYRASDGAFLGTLLVTIDGNGLVLFAPDAQLQASIPKAGAMSRWPLGQFTVVVSTGSGYHVITTTNNLSPNGLYQSVATTGKIQILSRKTGTKVATFPGAAAQGFTPATFTPDSNALAAWDGDSNRTTLWRVADGEVLMEFPDALPVEGLAGIRFSPDGTRMVTSGYFAFEGTGGWEQFGYVRFWRVADGVLRQQFDQHTCIGVTSAIAWSPDATQFLYGTYEGTAVAAGVPAP
jgi:WD40 repeat protein